MSKVCSECGYGDGFHCRDCGSPLGSLHSDGCKYRGEGCVFPSHIGHQRVDSKPSEEKDSGVGGVAADLIAQGPIIVDPDAPDAQEQWGRLKKIKADITGKDLGQAIMDDPEATTLKEQWERMSQVGKEMVKVKQEQDGPVEMVNERPETPLLDALAEKDGPKRRPCAAFGEVSIVTWGDRIEVSFEEDEWGVLTESQYADLEACVLEIKRQREPTWRCELDWKTCLPGDDYKPLRLKTHHERMLEKKND